MLCRYLHGNWKNKFPQSFHWQNKHIILHIAVISIYYLRYKNEWLALSQKNFTYGHWNLIFMWSSHHEILFPFIFFQSSEIIRTILSLQSTQKLVAGWIEPAGPSLWTHILSQNLQTERPLASPAHIVFCLTFNNIFNWISC